MDVGSIVLAGGKGLRLGHEKALETVGNKSLIQWVVLSLSFFTGDIIITTSTEQPPFPLVDYPRVKMVSDTYPDKGPLGGVHTGLAASDSFYNFVVACDMPFLNQALLDYMVQGSAGFDVVIPRLGDMIEPLHAVYSKRCLTPIEHLLKQGTLSVRELFALVRVRYVEAVEIDRFDPEHLSFFNINTEAELKMAREIARGDISDDKR